MLEGERGYLTLLREIINIEGEPEMDRTGVGTWRMFGADLRFDLARGFPLLTTKRVFWRGVLAELLWFLRGECNATSLAEDGVHIWDAWADDFGGLGPVYGAQWRSWGGRDLDQVKALIEQVKQTPTTRRAVVSAWNVEDLPKMALPPCHILWQVAVERDGRLSMKVYQRSADIFLGLPFNIASYAALLMWLSAHLGRAPGVLHMSLGDVHLYANHREQALQQLSRRNEPLPTLSVEGVELDELEARHFTLSDYRHAGPLRGEVAV
jgi:thymidylate synthase